METHLPTIITGLRALNAVVFFGGGGISSSGIIKHFDLLGNVEYWSVAADTYRANFPQSKVLERDIRTLTSDEILDVFLQDRKELDLLQISEPCVEKSITGKQRMWHASNDLGFVGLKHAFHANPKAILCEQVDSLIHENLAVLWSMTLAVIERYGSNYNVDAWILNSHNYGDNTSRKRLFIQLIRKDIGFPRWPQPVAFSKRGKISDFLPDVEYVVDTNFTERSMPPELPICTITAHPTLKKKISATGELLDLTPRDLARATGLPDTFQLLGSIANQKAIIGNGIPVHVTAALAGCIASVIREAEDVDTVDAGTDKSESEIINP